MPCQTRCSSPLFNCASSPRRVTHVSAWADVTTPPWTSSSRSSRECCEYIPAIVGARLTAGNSALWTVPTVRKMPVHKACRRTNTRARDERAELEQGGLLDDVDQHAQPDRQGPLVEVEGR